MDLKRRQLTVPRYAGKVWRDYRHPAINESYGNPQGTTGEARGLRVHRAGTECERAVPFSDANGAAFKAADTAAGTVSDVVGTDPDFLVEREGLEPSTPAL